MSNEFKVASIVIGAVAGLVIVDQYKKYKQRKQLQKMLDKVHEDLEAAANAMAFSRIFVPESTKAANDNIGAMINDIIAKAKAQA